MEFTIHAALFAAVAYMALSFSWLVTMVLFHSKRGDLELAELKRVHNYVSALSKDWATKLIISLTLGWAVTFFHGTWLTVILVAGAWAMVGTLGFLNRYLRNVPPTKVAGATLESK
jgi:hypothetical protein